MPAKITNYLPKYLKKHINNLQSSSSYRKKHSEYVVEGLRICDDLIKSDTNLIATVFGSSFYQNKKNTATIEKISKISNQLYCIEDSIFNKISNTTSPQGILMVAKRREKSFLLQDISAGEKIVLLEKIQDPTNLGNILRTTEALGITKVILTDDCCDIYNQKVLRGSMGAIFRLEFSETTNIIDTLDRLHKIGVTSYSTVIDDLAIDIDSIKFDNISVILFGNEANGLSEKAIHNSKKKITIPITKSTNSLNVSSAAAIILYKAMASLRLPEINK